MPSKTLTAKMEEAPDDLILLRLLRGQEKGGSGEAVLVRFWRYTRSGKRVGLKWLLLGSRSLDRWKYAATRKACASASPAPALPPSGAFTWRRVRSAGSGGASPDG